MQLLNMKYSETLGRLNRPPPLVNRRPETTQLHSTVLYTEFKSHHIHTNMQKQNYVAYVHAHQCIFVFDLADNTKYIYTSP